MELNGTFGVSSVSLTHLLEHGVTDGAQVDRAFIRQEVENIEGSGGFGPLLLVAENEIDPLVELAGHKLALQSLQVHREEETMSVVNMDR